MAGVELVSGAVIGVAVQQLWNTIKEVSARNSDFKQTLDSLEKRIKLLAPKIEAMVRLNKELKGKDDNPNDEIRGFLHQLEKARELVSLCGDVKKFDIIKKCKYSKRLRKLDSSFEKLLNVEFQAEQALSIKKIMADIVKMNKKLDRIDLRASKNYNANACYGGYSLKKGFEFFIIKKEKKYGGCFGTWTKNE